MTDIQPLPLVWQKRFFDIALSVLLFVFASPLFILIMFALFIEHVLRGRPLDPLFYRDERVSRGRYFSLFKFNIFDQRVVETAHNGGAFIHTKHLEHKGQVVYVGWVLKQIYLDELPQLFCVLRGDMSLVGPRPLNREVFTSYPADIVPAIAYIQGGMTGNYQSHKSKYRVSAAPLDAFYLDAYKHSSGWKLIFLDLKIILKTLKVILWAEGA